MNKKRLILILGLVVLILVSKYAYNFINENQISTSNNTEVTSNSSENQSGSDNNENASETNTEKIKAPNFIVKDVNGNNVEFEKLIGKPIVLNFWATWCGYCREEMPDFQSVYEEYKDTDLVVMMINATDSKNENRENVEKYLHEHNLSLPVYYDEAVLGVDGLSIENSAQAAYGVPGYPATVFIDKEGNIASTHMGLIKKDKLVSEIEKIIK